jgi:transposase
MAKAKEVSPMAIVFYGGLDVHQESIVAFLFCPDTGEVIEDQLPNDRQRVIRAVARWQRKGEVRLCYEASSCGFVVPRWLEALEVRCEVVAPAFIPKGAGDRIKTDRRDARRLAQLYHAGVLHIVRVPTAEEETARSLVRHRDDLTRDMTRCKNRILKQLSLLGLRYSETKRHWTQKHRMWLSKLTLDPIQGYVLNNRLLLLDELIRLRDDTDRRIEELAGSPAYKAIVQRLICLRGIGLYSAMVLATEIGDARRFGKPKALMSYLGVVPREYNSGNTQHSGHITKVGNRRARWILGEAAWRQTSTPKKNARLETIRKTQPPEVVEIARKAETRLHHKFWKLAVRTDRNTAAVAVAREMAGFVWAMMTLEVA